MIKKISIFVLAAMIVLPSFLSADEASSGNYKIKRLVEELKNTRTAYKAERRLSSYGDEAVPYVLALLKDNDSSDTVKITALTILAQIGDESIEDELVPFLRDTNKRIRQQTAKTLGVFAVKETTIEPLKKLLSDYDAEVRFNAIRALSRLARKEDTQMYVMALGDYDPRVRKFAVNALGKIKDPSTVTYLAQMVRDYHPEVRMELARTLKNINDESCVEPLFHLTNDIDPNVRLFAVKQLNETYLPGSEQAIIAVTNNLDPNIASKAIVELGKRDSPEALEVARMHLDDEYLVTKLAAIEVLGLKGGNDEIAKLETFEDAESTLVREKAKDALIQAQSRM